MHTIFTFRAYKPLKLMNPQKNKKENLAQKSRN